MRKHNYVVGYEQEGNVAYGKDLDGRTSLVHLMTEFQATRSAEKLVTQTERKLYQGVVYKLVKVKVNK